jgi:glycogen synthase
VRILTVGNMYPPLHLGGYELVWQAAVRHLCDRGHVVRVLTTDFRLDEVEGGAADDDVHRELRWYWRDHEWPRLSARQRWALERHNARVMERHLAEFGPDLVSWWAMGGISLSLIERVRRRGLPSAAVVCDDWMLYGPLVAAWLRVFASRPRLGRLAEALTGIPTRVQLSSVGPCLFPSETTRSRTLDAQRLPATVVCHQGVDRSLFRPAPAHPWRWRLLYVGRIDARKGIDAAILALTMLPEEAELAIAGDGDRRHLAELQELAAANGLSGRVRFGQAPRPALPGLYGEADTLVFPVRWEEPWGLVPLEAMAVGTPVLATGRGGSGEYLRDRENCLLFDPDGGPSALAGVVRQLAEDPELRTQLREGGFETAARFSEDEWNLAVERLCERAVEAAR